MNPCDYKTWTSFADHPVFSNRAHSVADWSSDPTVYDDGRTLPAVFDPDWYVHQEPRLATDIQSACAAQDIRNLVDACASLEQRFGPHCHELFILDDLTVYVRVTVGSLTLNIYPMHLDDDGNVLMLFLESPIEIDELAFKSVADVVPKLDSLLRSA